MKSRVTLRDIAAAANLHYSTVSLALRDHPRITPALRGKIKAIAAKMGYVPDPALAALNAYRKTKLPVHYQSTLAWIDNWKGRVKMRAQPTFNDYFEGAAERSRELGYELEEFRLEDHGVSPERASKILQSRGIHGLLLAPQPEAGMRIPFNYEWFSSVAFGYSLQPRVFHLVTNHQFHSMQMTLQELTKLGYRKIGLIGYEDLDNKVDNSYVTGYWHFMRKRTSAVYIEPNLIPKEESDRDSFLKWFRKYKPDAVISMGHLGVIDWLQEIGLKVPGDVGYSRLSIARDDQYYSGIYENGRIIGRTAVDFLVGMLQRGEYGFPETPVRILVEGIWKPGTTVRHQ